MPSIVLKVQVLVIMSGPKCCLFSPLCYQFAFFGNSFNQHQHITLCPRRENKMKWKLKMGQMQTDRHFSCGRNGALALHTLEAYR